ncbi:cell division protein SepF [Paenibacillus sp.]|uniref:cell division protein SepF n=1 Tax=Paenibacillus sp. TaxID=58172 RepID=UPI002D6B4A67|nr:cell division protein SepF [Paenibacillus sp.]HZG55172.1 cell division protein SepF [Paenibacillus sp.]
MGMMNKIFNFLGLQEEEEVVDREAPYGAADEPEREQQEFRRVKNNVVSLHAQKSSKLVLCEPRNYEETQDIADHLRARKAILVNLQRVRPEQAMRIVDFLSGTVYALNGAISKVGPNIFVCTPDSVEIQGVITDMMNDNT